MPTDPLSDFDWEIVDFLVSAGVPAEIIQILTPAQRDFGERAVNVSRMARELRKAPKQIAEDIAARFAPTGHYRFIEAVEPVNGFVNFRLDYGHFVPHVIQAVRSSATEYGRRSSTQAERIVVEHTSVNPNKEWHIGHVRNAVLGDVVGRLLALAGHEVEIQNYIDDTGVQAAQAVFGLQAFPETPIPGEKYDHYVGRAYVKVSAELGSEVRLKQQLQELSSVPDEQLSESDRFELVRATARLENIQRLKENVFRTMHALEQGEFHGTIEQILNGQLETAYRLGIFYDLLNWESHLVRSQLFQRAIDLLNKSHRVSKPKDGRYAGALVIETGPPPAPDEGPKCEVLIRSNGIPTYVGKDIAYHMWKFGVVPDRLRYVEYSVQPNARALRSTALEGNDTSHPIPDRVINIIAVDQTLPQEAVKEGLRAGEFPEAADHLVHLAYGLVSTIEGKLSGRKGTAVGADAVIDEAVRVALERVREKRSQDLSEADMEGIAEAVGIGAVRYFMTQYNPLRDIVFDVQDVVSYDGNTALYIQYALVRMFAILRRAEGEHQVSQESIETADPALLRHEQEKRLIFHLALYPELVAAAGRTLAVNLIAEYAFDLATVFNQFYRDCGVLNADPDLRAARLLLVHTVRDVLAQACSVLGVPVIERL